MIKCFLICSKISSDIDFFVECSARQPQRVPRFLLTLVPLCTPSAWVWLNTVKTHCDTWDSAMHYHSAMQCDVTSEIRLERLSLPSYTLTLAFFHSLAHLLQAAMLWATLLKASHGKDLISLVSSQQGHRPANSQERDLGNGSLLSCLRWLSWVSPAESLIVTCESPRVGDTQLNYSWVPGPQKLWDDKCVLF